jgi:hypothetical protein
MRIEPIPLAVSIGVGGISAAIINGILDMLNNIINPSGVAPLWYAVIAIFVGIINCIFIYTFIIYHRESND